MKMCLLFILLDRSKNGLGLLKKLLCIGQHETVQTQVSSLPYLQMMYSSPHSPFSMSCDQEKFGQQRFYIKDTRLV
jgi:hypothetical protein